MKLKTTIPKLITFTDPVIAYACACWMRDTQGWTFHANMCTENFLRKWKTERAEILYFETNNIEWGASGDENAITPFISTFPQFLDLVTEKPIMCGDYEAEVKEDGVQVGCTFVPWATVEALLKRKPKQEDPLAGREYRFLASDEKGDRFNVQLKEIESEYSPGKWNIGYAADSSWREYRTKLTREELAEKRRAKNVPV